MLDTILNTLGGPNGDWWLVGGYFSMVLGERASAFIKGARNDDGDALARSGST